MNCGRSVLDRVTIITVKSPASCIKVDLLNSCLKFLELQLLNSYRLISSIGFRVKCRCNEEELTECFVKDLVFEAEFTGIHSLCSLVD